MIVADPSSTNGVMQKARPAVRWASFYWAEGDTLFVLAADEEGWVQRQVELKGPKRTPVVAADRAECPDPQIEGSDALLAYQAKWGGLSDQPMTHWVKGFPHEEISRESFEEVWATSRQCLAETVRAESTHQATSLWWIVGPVVVLVAITGIAVLRRRRRGRTGPGYRRSR
jgi:hypothetical protein